MIPDNPFGYERGYPPIYDITIISNNEPAQPSRPWPWDPLGESPNLEAIIHPDIPRNRRPPETPLPPPLYKIPSCDEGAEDDSDEGNSKVPAIPQFPKLPPAEARTLH